MQFESHVEFVFFCAVYVSWMFEVVSVTVALYTNAFSEVLAGKLARLSLLTVT